jgi:AcrR family transcriptional regulator
MVFRRARESASAATAYYSDRFGVKILAMAQQLKRSSYHHGNLKQALIDAATQMILETGIGSVTMRALARRVGVSPAAYAYHFPDKASLLVAIAAEGFRKLNSYFDDASKETEPLDKLSVLGRRYLDFSLEYPGHYRVMFGDHSELEEKHPQPTHVTEEFMAESSRAFNTLVDTLSEVLEGTRSRWNNLEAALAVWSQIHGAVLLWNTGMYPPPVADSQERSEQEFRELTLAALRNTVDGLARGS